MATSLDALTGWVLFAGLIVILGANASRWLILPRTEGTGPTARYQLVRETVRVGLVGAAVLLGGLGLFFARQLIEFRDPFSAWSDEAGVLLNTPWGQLWLLATLGAACLLPGFLFARRFEKSWWLVTPLSLALASFPAFTGHAAGVDDYRSLLLLADTVHVWAAGSWIGGLATILWLERAVRRDESDVSVLSTLVPRFSPVAMVSVGALISTGVLASWTHLPSADALFTTQWGQLLLVKVFIAGGVLAIGARNYRTLSPRLGTASGDQAMRRSAAAELILVQLVLIVTAILVRTSPTVG